MLPSVAVIASFALVVGLLTVTPGLDTALVLRSLLAQRLSQWLQRRKVARTIDGVTGTVIVGFGVGGALEGVSR